MNTTSFRPISKITLLVAMGLWLCACIYRLDISQGNRLDESVIDQIEIGMTRSQVQFLLGSPMVADSFHQNRWDYTYYFRQGRSREVERRWLVVYFENDRVTTLDKDAVIEPPS